MHGTHMRCLLVAAGALVVGLLAAGTPLQHPLRPVRKSDDRHEATNGR